MIINVNDHTNRHTSCTSSATCNRPGVRRASDSEECTIGNHTQQTMYTHMYVYIASAIEYIRIHERMLHVTSHSLLVVHAAKASKYNSNTLQLNI